MISDTTHLYRVRKLNRFVTYPAHGPDAFVLFTQEEQELTDRTIPPMADVTGPFKVLAISLADCEFSGPAHLRKNRHGDIEFTSTFSGVDDPLEFGQNQDDSFAEFVETGYLVAPPDAGDWARAGNSLFINKQNIYFSKEAADAAAARFLEEQEKKKNATK